MRIFGHIYLDIYMGTACDILKSDAMKHNTDAEILAFVEKNLFNMDRWTGGI